MIKKFLNAQKSLTAYWLQIAIGLGLLSGFLLIAQAWFLAKVVNGVIFEKQQLDDVQLWLWLLLAIFIFRSLLAWASEQAAFHASAKIKQHLRSHLHRHLQLLGPLQVGDDRSGERVNTLVDGIEALENYYARYLPAMSLVVLVPLSILVFVFPVDWISGLVMLVTAPLIPFFMILIGKGTEQLNKKQWRKLARMSAHFLDMIQGLTTLKIFNTSKHEAEVIARISEDYRRSTMAVLRVAFLSSLVLEFLATISIALVAVLIGFRLFYGEMDFLLGFFVLLLAPEFYLPLRNMGTHYHARMEAVGAAEQMLDILDKQPSRPDPLVSLDNVSTALLQAVLTQKEITLQFKQLSFCYSKGRNALNKVDFEIKAGQHIALVGASGAGKSTLANLLLGFIQPPDNSVYVNGVDLNQLPLDLWRELIVWVPQRPYLFHASIADNIRLSDSQATEQDVIRVARLAHCDTFIDALPQGYQTQIGEQGEGLSGGQIQRLAIARALLKDAPLVILDEATANLDSHNEGLIQQSLSVLMQHRTVITISHRLNTIQQADFIVVMDKGQVVDMGSHQQLLDAQSPYYNAMLASFEGSQQEGKGV